MMSLLGDLHLVPRAKRETNPDHSAKLYQYRMDTVHMDNARTSSSPYGRGSLYTRSSKPTNPTANHSNLSSFWSHLPGVLSHYRASQPRTCTSCVTEGTKILTPLDAFIMYRGELLTGMSSCDVLILANQLYSTQQIISRERFDRIRSELNPTERIISLINAIEDSIKLNPSAYYLLLGALDGEPILSIIADKLRATAGTKVCSANIVIDFSL